MTVRVRFAPSPTGQLHVGNVRTALFNWLFARQQGGHFILRIEDTDLERSRQEYEATLLEDLRWFGLDWDEGPDVGGAYGPYRQSERVDIYRRSARELVESGRAYPCFCTEEDLSRERAQAVAEHRPYTYSGRCRQLSANEVAHRLQAKTPHTIRFRVRPGLVAWDDLVHGRIEWSADLIGDFVILKSDGWPVYNFAVVVDDRLMRITHVIRGDGHLPNTPRQLLLYEALQAPPPLFAHLSTVLGPDGTKLSKRHGATSLGEFREKGYVPEALFNYLALLGWAPPEGQGEILSRTDLLALFRLERVSKAPAIFDITKLNWMNRTYIKAMPREKLVDAASLYLEKAGRIGPERDENMRAWLGSVVEAVITHLDTLSDIVTHTSVIFEYDLEAARAVPEIAHLLGSEEALEVLRLLDEELAKETTLTRETFRAACARVSQRTGRKGRALLHPLRLALTARPSGPELDKLIPIFEQGSRLPLPRPLPSVRQRLERFLRWAQSLPASSTR